MFVPDSSSRRASSLLLLAAEAACSRGHRFKPFSSWWFQCKLQKFLDCAIFTVGLKDFPFLVRTSVDNFGSKPWPIVKWRQPSPPPTFLFAFPLPLAPCALPSAFPTQNLCIAVRLLSIHTSSKMTFIQDLLKPGGGIALIPFIRGTIATLLVLVM